MGTHPEKTIARKSILVVEDEGLVAMDLKRRLESFGYVVPAVAKTADDAVRLAALHLPDLILMDIHLKGRKDGIEAAEEVRKQFDIPIIYVTAHTDSATLSRAKLTEPVGYIAKPFGSTDIRVQIEIAHHKYQVERKLRKSEAWFSTTLRNIEDAVISTGLDGAVEFMNLAAERLTGWTLNEARRKPVLDVFVIVDANAVSTLNPVLVVLNPEGKDHMVIGEYQLYHRDGSVSTIESVVTVNRNEDGQPGALIAFRDITAQRDLARKVRQRATMEAISMLASSLEHDFTNLRSSSEIARLIGNSADIDDYKQAVAAVQRLNESLEERVQQRTAALEKANDDLGQTRAKLQNVLDAATQVAIIVADTEGVVQIFNSGAERILQYRACEIEGIEKAEIYSDKSEYRDRAAILSREFGRPITGFEVFAEYTVSERPGARDWTYVRKDGTRLDVDLAVTAIHSPGGVLQGYLSIASDTSVRKALERELRVNNEKLVEQTRRATEANLAKSNFLAAMSHEIRTPMNAILGMADILWESQLDAEQMQYVEVFRRAGSNLLTLINNILDLSKIEAGHLELEHVNFDLQEIVERAIELTGVKTRAKGLALLSRLSPGTATALRGDPNRLRQVLINLLGNAVKFTDSGEIVLTVENGGSGKPGDVTFSISDTGIGIAPEKLETIFDDFSQADTSTTRKYGGTGLGLSISRRLVESMGGRLTAFSSPGKGSTFRFTASYESSLRTDRNVQPELEDFHGRRILVIDENATNRLILRETVNAWDLQSDEFALPQEALAGLSDAMAGKQPYSLVLLDSCTSGMNGFEAATEIRRIAPDLPIVMLTLDSLPGDAIRRREAGISGFAIKPVKRTELLRLICDAMKSRVRPEPQAQPLEASPEAAEPVSQLRILVAEDSPDNRLLIQVYAKGTSHRLTFAEDGKVAVQRFTAAEFDLILMDIQMPVMDGLTATREIRAIERDRGAGSIPIIALTANARPQDIEMSHDAGCSDHFSKPISKQKLLSAIEEYGRRQKAPAKPQVASPESIRIEMPSGLEEIVPGYLADRRQEVLEMMTLLAASDFEQLAGLGHNLKGSGGSYGFPKLTEIGADLEQLASGMGAGALSRRLSALSRRLADLKEYLDRVQLIDLSGIAVLPTPNISTVRG